MCHAQRTFICGKFAQAHMITLTTMRSRYSSGISSVFFQNSLTSFVLALCLSLGATASQAATVPDAPTSVKATAGNQQARVTFIAPVNNGGSSITGYSVISNPPGGMDMQDGDTSTSHVITGLTNGVTYTFTVKATNVVGGSAESNPSNAATPSALAVGRAGFIGFYPAQPDIPVLAGTGNLITPAILNMSTEAGRSVAFDVSAILSRVVGVSYVYAGQSGGGTMLLNGVDGSRIAFTPVDFNYANGLADGLYAVGNGKYEFVFKGLSLTVIPAVIELDQLRNSLPGAKIVVSDKGIVTAAINGTIYSVQPEVNVTRGNGGNLGVSSGSDGTPRFTDNSGNVQRLDPAFVDVNALEASAKSLDPNAQMAVNLDGTVSLWISGWFYTLFPDIELGKIPAEKQGQLLWQEGANRFRIRNGSPGGTSQGFTVR